MYRPSLATLLLAGLIAGSVTLSLAAPAGAQGPSLQVEQAPCVPNNDNGLIRATIQPEVGGAEPRLYFRWVEHGEFYYVIMEAAGNGGYWVTPPKPTDDNEKIEYYLALVDPQGSVLARSELLDSPVTNDCPVVLDDVQRGFAENLTVGETVEEQVDDDVTGFLCDGIVSRIGSNGVPRADSICRRCIIAWWEKPEVVVPAAVVLGGGVILGGGGEVSPSRP